jgi:hypothetical protein
VANEDKNKYVHISSPNVSQNYNIKTINKSLETGKVKFRSDVKIKITFTKTLRADYTRGIGSSVEFRVIIILPSI